MSGPDLLAEMLAYAGNVRRPQLEYMESKGVPLAAIGRIGAHQPPFGITRARFQPSKLWEPDEAGVPAVIVPVCRGAAIDFAGIEVPSLDIIDLIAFRTSAPAFWQWRTGTGWALGLDRLESGEPVEIVSNPIRWLAQGGEALCILNWGAPASEWLRLMEARLIVRDPKVRQHISDAFRRIAPRPDLVTA